MSTINVVSGAAQAVNTQPTSAVDPTKANQNTQAVTKPPPPPPPPPKTDTVHLSAEAQAKALKQSGKTPAEIAFSMNLDVKTVDSYLGITDSSTTATTTTSSATPPTTPTGITASTTSSSSKIDIKV